MGWLVCLFPILPFLIPPSPSPPLRMISYDKQKAIMIIPE